MTAQAAFGTKERELASKLEEASSLIDHETSEAAAEKASWHRRQQEVSARSRSERRETVA